MAKLAESVILVENRWLEEIYTFCKGCFSGVHIPSHDHTHHWRVWQLAKQLMGAVEAQGTDRFTYEEVEQIFLAIFFHDTGLIETLDARHGLAGRMICAAYFAKHYPNWSGDLEPILSAIEHHDDKSYKNRVYGGGATDRILPILCVCDDLDAFGLIGVFRYYEIYHLRGLRLPELPELVVTNLSSRFAHFEQLYGHLGDFAAVQRERFQRALNFYQSLLPEAAGTALYQEHRAILTMIDEEVLAKQGHLNEVVGGEWAPTVQRFLDGVKKEWVAMEFAEGQLDAWITRC